MIKLEEEECVTSVPVLLYVHVRVRVMSKVAFKGIPYPYMAMLPVLSPSPYAILCIEQVSTMVKGARSQCFRILT